MEEPELGPIFCLGCYKHFSERLQWRIHRARQCVASRLSLSESKEAVKSAFIHFAPTGLDDSYVPNFEHDAMFENGPSNLSGFDDAPWSQQAFNSVFSPWRSAQEDDPASLGDTHQIGLQDDMFGRLEKEQGDRKQQEGIVCVQPLIQS